MFNHKDFLGSQADRQAQIRFAERQDAVQAIQVESRLGPVFGPLLARIGDGMVATGMRLQGRHAALHREASAPIAPLCILAPQD